MAKNWRLTLPEEFNRRIEDGSLVLWRPELTFWINIWNNDQHATVDELLGKLMAGANPERRQESIKRTDDVIGWTYELAEEVADSDDAACTSVNGYIISALGYVQISAYVDTPEARSLGSEIIDSVCLAR
jgi:hypothetical protein